MAFQAGNLFGNLFTAIANQTTVVYPLHDAILNAKTLVNILEHVQVDVAVSSPKVVEVLASDSAMLEFVSSKIGALGYAGGNISNAAGCTLASSLKLFSVYAQTENGINATIRPAYSWGEIDWGCLHFHPQAGYEFRHIVNEEFELVIVRKSNPTEEQPVFKVFPHLQEWSTKDVFIPDVARPGGWIYRSRADDIINFNDGTTFNPVVFEQHVNGHPDIRDSVMLGTQRPQASLLIELNSPRVLSESERTDVINDIWPLVSKANAECNKQSTIPRSHIMFTLPEKPLPRASKGTVQRALAVKLYAEELHALY